MYTSLEPRDRHEIADWSYDSIKLVSIDIIDDREFLQHAFRPDHGAVDSNGQDSSGADADDHPSTSTTNLLAFENPTKPLRKQQGWRFSAALFGWTATVACLINIGLLIYAIAIWDRTGLCPVSTGNCRRISNLGIAAHVVINIISSVLLSASNFCMQCLSAPTRADIDRQHKRGMWMDIGVPSIRNLTQISSVRFGLWLLLAASSMPLHLLYNAAAFKTISANGYTVATMASSTVNSHMTAGTLDFTALGLPNGLNFSNVRNLTTKDCVAAYGTQLLSEYRDLLIVVSAPVSRLPNGTWMSRSYQDLVVTMHDGIIGYPNGSSAFGGTYTFTSSWGTNKTGVLDSTGAVVSNHSYPTNVSETYSPLSLDWSSAWKWMCPYANSESVSNNTICFSNKPSDSANWTLYYNLHESLNTTDTYSVHADYCLAQVVQPRCRLLLSVPILAIVVFCNICKVIAIFSTLALRQDMLLSVGDAIASFLQEPDECTNGLGLISLDDVRDLGTAVRRTGVISEKPLSVSWSLKDGLVGTACLVWLLATVGGTTWLIRTSRIGDLPWTTLVSLGFGKIDSTHAIVVRAPTQLGQALLATLLANLPQLWVSSLYLIWNSCCTSMHLAWECSQFANVARYLRVTYPRESCYGKQRPTYWLTLPLRFSIPMIVLSFLVHWLLSLTVFPVMVNFNLSETSAEDQLWVGYTYAPVIFALLLGLLAICITVYFSFRKLRSPMPVVSCCSWAISAACHPPADDTHAATKPVQWGDVGGSAEEFGHCTFTSQNVAPLDAKKKYM